MSREYIKNNVPQRSYYILLHVFVYVKEKKNKEGHILYSQNRFFVYTVHKTSLRERERETLSVVQLRTSAFPFYDPISVLEILNFSTTTFVYEYITRMAC